MKTKIDYFDYDTLLQPTDWRFAAAVVGLCKYFDYFGIDYKVLYDVEEKPDNYIHGFDGIIYKSEDITEEKYLEFAENYFEKYMTHKNILNILESQEFSEEQIKLVNDLVKSKTVLKGLLGKTKFDGTNKDIFISTIEENRAEIIKNIFKRITAMNDLFLPKITALADLEATMLTKTEKQVISAFVFQRKVLRAMIF